MPDTDADEQTPLDLAWQRWISTRGRHGSLDHEAFRAGWDAALHAAYHRLQGRHPAVQGKLADIRGRVTWAE